MPNLVKWLISISKKELTSWNEIRLKTSDFSPQISLTDKARRLYKWY
jgi:hypothetical protein